MLVQCISIVFSFFNERFSIFVLLSYFHDIGILDSLENAFCSSVFLFDFSHMCQEACQIVHANALLHYHINMLSFKIFCIMTFLTRYYVFFYQERDDML